MSEVWRIGDSECEKIPVTKIMLKSERESIAELLTSRRQHEKTQACKDDCS